MPIRKPKAAQKLIQELWRSQEQINKSDRLYGTANLNAKGQLVIPAEARKDFGYQPGDQLMILGNKLKKVMIIVKSGTLNEFLAIITEQLSGSGIEKEITTHLQGVFANSARIKKIGKRGKTIS